jgi:hypothetical protein
MDTYVMEQLAAALSQFTATFGGGFGASDFTRSLSIFAEQSSDLVRALNAHTVALDADLQTRNAHTNALAAHTSALRSHEEALYASVRQAQQQ